MKFYIGSGMKNRILVNYYVKALKEIGWKHTYNWTDNVNKEITKKTWWNMLNQSFRELLILMLLLFYYRLEEVRILN